MVISSAKRNQRYGVTRTLLGGEPDVNRRTIVDSWNDFAEVCVFNCELDEWTVADDRLLELVLAALNTSTER